MREALATSRSSERSTTANPLPFSRSLRLQCARTRGTSLQLASSRPSASRIVGASSRTDALEGQSRFHVCPSRSRLNVRRPVLARRAVAATSTDVRDQVSSAIEPRVNAIGAVPAVALDVADQRAGTIGRDARRGMIFAIAPDRGMPSAALIRSRERRGRMRTRACDRDEKRARA